MYIPTTIHVTPLATIRRERTLPQPGFVLVDDGERVEATTIVAKTESFVRHYVFDLAQKLGVDAKNVGKYLRVQAGIAMEKGEIIAQRTDAFFNPKPVRAPAKGTVVEINESKVLFAATGPEIEVLAGFPGFIASVSPDWGVIVETSGALVQAAWGTGKQEYGVLKMLVNDPSQPLAPDLLDASARGAIVVAGQADEAGLKAAEAAKVRGLVLGSLPSTLIRAARTLRFPLIVVEGFGNLTMSPHAWTLFADHNGREAYMDARPPDRWEARRPEVIVPLPHPGGVVPVPADGQPIDEGRRVRVTRAPYAGRVGTVTMLLPRRELLPSGVSAMAARVELESQGEVLLPLANLEIYE